MFTGDERRLRISGKQYFSPELLPERLKARAFRLNGEGAFENREDVTVLSIRRGKGRMVLNNRVYPLEPGDGVYSLSISRLEGPGR